MATRRTSVQALRRKKSCAWPYRAANSIDRSCYQLLSLFFFGSFLPSNMSMLPPNHATIVSCQRHRVTSRVNVGTKLDFEVRGCSGRALRIGGLWLVTLEPAARYDR